MSMVQIRQITIFKFSNSLIKLMASTMIRALKQENQLRDIGPGLKFEP